MTATLSPPDTSAARNGGPVQNVRVAIVGAGFSGLGMAIRLEQEGIEDFVVLEKADDVGGTWRDNSYPGCACDVPSHLYSFSFAPNPEWSSTFSPQPEIWDYLRDCSERFGITPHLRFGCELLDARWDEAARRWQVHTAGGDWSAEVLIDATGGLSDPSFPPIPGLDSFEGTYFHSAQWDHDHDLTGERVAVIGTGASAIQIVPQIQPRVAELTLFQRTPPWIVPRRDRPLTQFERRLYRALPAAQLAMRAGIYWARESLVFPFNGHKRLRALNQRVAMAHLRRQVPDPELRRRLTPDYEMGCKRILISNDYYPALMQPNVELISAGVTEIRPHSIVGSDGTEREVDTIVFATGFHVIDGPSTQRIRDAAGRSIADLWDGSPRAYKGTTIAGFPNLFRLTGPNTGLGHNSIVFMIESQLNYIADALRLMRERHVDALEVRADAQAAYNRWIDERLVGTVWSEGGCASWYLDSTGRNSTLWPGFTWGFRERTRRFDPAAYHLRAATGGRAAPALQAGAATS
jgi:cation diffusion facilitator CzcD-associated flavoprotein CzcO